MHVLIMYHNHDNIYLPQLFGKTAYSPGVIFSACYFVIESYYIDGSPRMHAAGSNIHALDS